MTGMNLLSETMNKLTKDLLIEEPLECFVFSFFINPALQQC